jgi:hypothetical protein
LCTEKNMFFSIFIHSNKPTSSRLCRVPYHSPKWNSKTFTITSHNLWYEICSRTLGLWILVMGTFHYQG